MKKYVICALLIVAVLAGIMPVGVSASIATAKEIMREDFSKPEGITGLWPPDGWICEVMEGTDSLENTASIGVTDDNYILLDRGEYDGTLRIMYNSLPSVPSEFTYTVDVKATKTSSTSAWFTANFNGYYVSATAGGAVEYMSESGTNTYQTFETIDDVWYTYCYQVKGDRMSVYRKERDSDMGYIKLLDNVKMQVRSGHRIYVYSLKGVDNVGVDNIRITEGIIPVSSEITFGDGAGTNKKITGTLTVSARSVSPTAPRNVIALMTIHDSRGRIVDIVSKPVVLEFDENTFVLEREYSAQKYEKMQGGTAKIYLWESFDELEPLTKAYAVTVQ